MTNILTYYTYTEMFTAILSVIFIASILAGYSIYYLKKRAGLFLLLTLLAPIVFSFPLYVFSGAFGLNVSGFNAIAITWFPILFTLSHTIYFTTRLHNSKTHKNDFKFEFLKEIRWGNIVSIAILVLIALSTIALFPIQFVISTAVGILITIVSVLINTFIIIKRI